MPQSKDIDPKDYDRDGPHRLSDVYQGKGLPPAHLCVVCDVYVPEAEVESHKRLPPSFRSAKAPMKSV